MIFCEKLVLLRKQNEFSQEQLAEQLGVSRQAVSKWESGASAPDLDKMVRLSELFGVSLDYLVKDDAPQTLQEDGGALPGEEARVVSMEEANAYLDTVHRVAPRIAMGVMLCILSPVCLLLLGVMSETGAIALSENAAGGIGLVVLLIMVAVAVVLFILYGMQLSRYEYLEKELILTGYGVAGLARKLKEDLAPSFRRSVAIGVALCILSPLPLFACLIFSEADLLMVCSICLLLFIVSAAVFIFIMAGMPWAACQALLQEEDYTPEMKRSNKRTERIAPVYWCLVTAIYLAASFYSGAWGRTWIVWPVAGVLFGGISCALHLFHKER